MILSKRHLFFSAISLFSYISLLAGNVNIALNKPAVASSEQSEYPASKVTDGVISRTSSWVSETHSRPPHILTVNLQKYYDIDKIVVYTGIPDAEKKETEKGQAAGFWSVKNMKLQYWDDANWTDLPSTEVFENRLDKLEFSFKPVLTTFQVRLISTDGEPIRINEMEVYGIEKKSMPAPVLSNAIHKQDQEYERDIQATITKDVIGKTMKYVGYNQGYYFPGSNISGWLEYSNINSLRVWTSMNDFVPLTTILVDESLKSLEEFEAYKEELRNNPESNRFIKWGPILEVCKKKMYSTNSMVFEYTLDELKRLDIDVILQMNSTDFKNNWVNKWQQWQRYYALAFYAAKTGDVEMFAMQNEPNHAHSGPMKITQYVEGMRIVSDAINCAVQDVNKLYNKNLKPRFVSPVTAGSNANWWAEVIKNIRQDYRGLPAEKDLIDIFSTHSYNLPALGYASKVSDIRAIIQDNHPLGQSLPIVYTETGRWMNAYLIDKEETMDSPSLFTEWAGEYTNNTLNQGYGMWAFKFANTTSGTYPRGIKSGHHFIWQGKRIVEDAYKNVALGKKTTDMTSSKPLVVKTITDGKKTDSSMWISSDTENEKILEIDLKSSHRLGGAVVYTGSAYGVYTGPDRIKSFRLQSWNGNEWIDIEEAKENNARYTQSFFLFKNVIETSRIRFIASDKGRVKVREIKLFTADSMNDIPETHDVSGIQRTGEVVRLFAKGFKDERPLLNTERSVNENDLDIISSFDPCSMNYYVWLVQRKKVANNVTLDLKALDLPVSTKVIAEEVSDNAYGEVVWVKEISDGGLLNFELPARSVVLLTIPVKTTTATSTLTAIEDAVVKGGKSSNKSFGTAKVMNVEMNASNADKNQVSYLKFDLSDLNKNTINAAVLKVYGKTSDQSPYRLHVYALEDTSWNEQSLTWNSAPNLDTNQVRIKDVGRSAHIAGEISFTSSEDYHMLDVTSILRKNKNKAITFVLVREVRQLGDDADNNRTCIIQTKESIDKPVLTVW